MLINKHLPRYTYNEHHKILVNGSVKNCFVVAKNLDISGSLVTKTLLKLRGLPAKDLSLPGFIKNIGFAYLEEDLYKEFVIDASQPNIKIIWNFHFQEEENNKTIVSTETRILCLSKRSKFFFSIYWFFIKPFSGIIRREMLRLIKEKVENK